MTQIKISEETFKQALADMLTMAPTERELVVHTGAHGMQMINDAMGREVARMRREFIKNDVDDLSLKGVLTLDEADRLVQMADSPDEENLLVVELILETKKAIYVSHLHSKESQV